MQENVSQIFLLAADIGGTTCRFGVFSEHDGRLRLERSATIPTGQTRSFDELLALLRQGPLAKLLPTCQAAALAVAGAVQAGGMFANPPNIAWSIDLREANLTGLPRRILLLNDFAAQAHACGTEAVSGAVTINPGVAEPGAIVGVIGAGTGLGHGLLLPLESGRMALPSEAGHAAFVFTGREERDYERFVLERTGLEYVYGDVAVSGRGLALLHSYHFGEDLEPAQAAAALNQGSPVQTWFARFYGRACRQFALTVLSLGGLYISGGVAMKNPGLVQAPAFMAEFVNNTAWGRLLASIPVALNINEEIGLWGAALAAGISLQGGGPATG